MQITQFIQSRICIIREEKVMLGSDIALLYNIEKEAFNHIIKINIKLFPALKKRKQLLLPDLPGMMNGKSSFIYLL